MQFLELGQRGLQAVGTHLSASEVLAAALASGACLRAFRFLERWLLSALRLDGARGHSPHGIFSRIATEELLFLQAEGLGQQLFGELGRWRFPKLAALELVESSFSGGGAKAVAPLVSQGSLRSLGLHRCFLDEAALRQLVNLAPSLRQLAISEAGLAVEFGDALNELVARSALEDLTLRGCVRLPAEFPAAVGRHAPLRHLRLTDNTLLTDKAVRLLCEHLRHGSGGSRLVDLDLSVSSGCGRLTDAAGGAVGGALAAGVQLRELRLAGHRMSELTLAACLSAGQSLRLLDFSGNSLAGAGEDGSLAAAAAASLVEALYIGGGEGDHDGFDEEDDEDETVSFQESEASSRHSGPLQNLAWVAPLLPRLVVLNASKAHLDDAAVASFVASAVGTSAPNLRDLDLSSNLIAEGGAMALLECLRRTGARLRRLDLSLNLIGDEGCSAVAAALRPGGVLSRATDLSVRATSLGRIDDLLAALPSALSLRRLDLRENLLGDAEVLRLLETRRRLRAERRGALEELRLEGNELSEELEEECRRLFERAAPSAEAKAVPNAPADTGGGSEEPHWPKCPADSEQAVKLSQAQLDGSEWEATAQIVELADVRGPEPTSPPPASQRLRDVNSAAPSAGPPPLTGHTRSSGATPGPGPARSELVGPASGMRSEQFHGSPPSLNTTAAALFSWEDDDLAGPPTAAEWQECLDTFEWVKSQIR